MTIIIADPNARPCWCGCGQIVPNRPLAQAQRIKTGSSTRRYLHGHSGRGSNRPLMGLPARFWGMVRVNPESGCWQWTGSKGKKGYGHGYGIFNLNRLPQKPHRLTYEALLGPIPPNFELDHLCRNRGCCNPEHLEPVTHAENMARSIRAMQTHCKRGHEFTEANTYRAKNGTRSCRRCHADREYARQVARRTEANQVAGDPCQMCPCTDHVVPAEVVPEVTP